MLIIYKGRRLRPLNGHKCDEKGGLILLQDGSVLPDHDYLQKRHRDDIRGWSVCCSVCMGGAFKFY